MFAMRCPSDRSLLNSVSKYPISSALVARSYFHTPKWTKAIQKTFEPHLSEARTKASKQQALFVEIDSESTIA